MLYKFVKYKINASNYIKKMIKIFSIIASLFAIFNCHGADSKPQDIEKHFEKLKTLTQNVIQTSLEDAQKNFSLKQNARQVIFKAFEHGKKLYSDGINHTLKLKAANLLISTYHVFYGITRPAQISKFLRRNQAQKDQGKLPLKWMQDMADNIHSQIEALPFLLDSVLRFPICENTHFESYLKSDSPFIQLKFLAHGSKSQFVDFVELNHYISLIEDSAEKEAKLSPWESVSVARIYFIRLRNKKYGRTAAYASGALRLLTSALDPFPSMDKIDPEADLLTPGIPLAPVEKFARALKNNSPFMPAIFLAYKILSFMRQNQAEFQGYCQYTELLPLLEDHIESSDSLLPEITFRKYEFLYEKNQYVLSENADRELQKAAFLGVEKATNIIAKRRKRTLSQQDYAHALRANMPALIAENEMKNAVSTTSFADVARKTTAVQTQNKPAAQSDIPAKKTLKIQPKPKYIKKNEK